MKNILDSVKQVMVVFLFCFVALISYIAYFQVFSAPNIAAQQSNKRLWAKRNEVLRGTIYDKNGTALTTSERVNALTDLESHIVQDKNEIVRAFESLSSSASDNAASTEEVSASTQEQAASIEDVASSSNRLSQLAVRLKELMEQFTI